MCTAEHKIKISQLNRGKSLPKRNKHDTSQDQYTLTLVPISQTIYWKTNSIKKFIRFLCTMPYHIKPKQELGYHGFTITTTILQLFKFHFQLENLSTLAVLAQLQFGHPLHAIPLTSFN